MITEVAAFDVRVTVLATGALMLMELAAVVLVTAVGDMGAMR